MDWIFSSWGGKLGGCYDPWRALPPSVGLRAEVRGLGVK